MVTPLIVWCLIVCCFTQSFALGIGEDAPEIYGRKLSKQLFKLSTYSGNIRVVNFFSVHCKPCKKELPELAEMENHFPHVVFIAVHLGDESMEKVNQFLYGLSGSPKLVVCSSLAVKTDYGFMGFPHSVIIDDNNHIRAIIPGYNTNLIKKTLQELSYK